MATAPRAHFGGSCYQQRYSSTGTDLVGWAVRTMPAGACSAAPSTTPSRENPSPYTSMVPLSVEGVPSEAAISSLFSGGYKLSFIDAFKRLGAWQNVSDADRPAIARKTTEREKKQAEQARLKSLAHEERIKLRDEIHTTTRIQRETSDGLGQLLQGGVGNYPQEQAHRWSTLALCLDDVRETEAQYMSSMGMEKL